MNIKILTTFYIYPRGPRSANTGSYRAISVNVKLIQDERSFLWATERALPKLGLSPKIEGSNPSFQEI